MSRYFFKTFFMYARPIPVQTKVHFKNLQFFAVAYDMRVLSFAFDVFKMAECFLPLFKQLQETEMTWSQPIIVRECLFKNQNVCFASR